MTGTCGIPLHSNCTIRMHEFESSIVRSPSNRREAARAALKFQLYLR